MKIIHQDQKGISMVSLVITIIVLLILAAIVFLSSLKTINEAEYSKYVSNVSDVATAFYETVTAVNGAKVAESNEKKEEQIYNYVAKAGKKEVDFLAQSEIPKYTLLKNEEQIGIKLPEMIVESGTGKRVIAQYATTKNGKIFTWPPYDYDGKYYITDIDTVENKMQTEITVGDEKFILNIDPVSGTLLEALPTKPEDNEETPGGNLPEEHDFSSKIQTPEYLCSEATCTTPAIYYYKCIKCSERGTETYTYGDVLDHSWSDYYVTTEATCNKKGIKTRTCRNCNINETEELPIDGENHSKELETTTIDATCIEEGKILSKCSWCKKTLNTKTINATGHSWSDFSITTEATCVKEGIKTKTCETCNINETEKIPIDEENHSKELETITTDATCTEEGKIVSKCSWCKDTLNTKTINATGHSWSDFSITTEATCVKEGIKTKTCETCKIAETEEIPIDEENHHGGDIEKTTIDATCTEEGKIVSSCSLCKKILNTEMTEVLGHTDENSDGKCDKCKILIGFSEKFSDNTWAQIAEACYNNAVPDTWLIGDTKSMLIDGEDYDVMIIGKHHDTFSDGSGTAPLTFQTVDIVMEAPMNDTNTVAGSWSGSNVYSLLNNNLFEKIEDDVKNNIKKVAKYTNIGEVDAGNTTPTTVRKSSDNLFLLSFTEVFCREDYPDYQEVYDLEGTQYEYYAKGGSTQKKYEGIGDYWWLRTPSSSTMFHYINYHGVCTALYASNSYGISFAFCFEGHPHIYEETISKQATCTEGGTKVFTCECGYSYVEQIDILSHEYAENIIKNATCIDVGTKRYTCDCGTTYDEEIPALGHTTTGGLCGNCNKEIWQLTGMYTFNETIDNSSYQGEYEIEGILGLTHPFTKMIIDYDSATKSHNITLLRDTGELEEMYNSTDGYVAGGNSAITVNTVDVTKEFYNWWILNTTVKECFAEGTYIMLADGTQKPIEEITFNDEVLAWDFHTGTYKKTTPSLIEAKEKGERRVINLYFEDNTTVRIITDHGFFDAQKNEFVFINESNVNSYIGHEFVKVDKNNQYTTTVLVDYSITNENISCYTIQTSIYNNCIAEGMFTLTSPPEGYDGWFDYFEIGENMKYDEDKKQLDIEQYGLYTYEEFEEYVTYEQFISFNGPYLKILVKKGIITFEQIINAISKYADVII